MRNALRNFGKILILAIALVLVLSIADTMPIKAASDDMKVVYSLKQLKKAMKAKGSSSIIFRTEVHAEITIPSVKAAKNKDLYIVAPNVKIKNKSKFNSITVQSVVSYTEAVSGNTIIWNDPYETDLIVAKGKTVNKIVLMNSSGGLPSYRLRKGAKVKGVDFVAYDGTVSKPDTKKKTVSIIFYGEYDYEYDTTVTYSFDKNGRIVNAITQYDQHIENDNQYVDERLFTRVYKYDKNGNCIRSECLEDGDTTVSKYDSDNNLVKEERISDNESFYTVNYEYDKKGNLIRIESGSSDSGPHITEYRYDKNGRRIEEKIEDPEDDYVLNITYKYDKSGRCIEETSAYPDGSDVKEYVYDENGLLSKMTRKSANKIQYIEEYSRDYLGNEIFDIATNYYEYDDGDSDSYRYEEYVGEYQGEYQRYEDGFVSPVKFGLFDKEAHEKAGYTVVDTAKELIEAIKPGAKIIIEPGHINLSEYIETLDDNTFNAGHKYVKLNRQTDGFELVIKNTDDLLISGGWPNYYATHLEIDPRYSAVFRFEDCDNLKLSSFTCGHSEKGNCEGNVIDLYNCKNVGIYRMEMYGCGVYGIGAFNGSGDIRVYDSIIHYCEYGIYEFKELGNKVTFENCLFYGSNGGGAIYGWNEDSPDVIFKRCSFGQYESEVLYFDKRNTYIDCLWT